MMVDATVHATPFDAVDDLVDAGFDEPRAKAIVRFVEGRRTDLVTTADLDSLEARLDAKLSAAVNKMMVAQVIMAGVILGGVAAIVALFQLPGTS